MNTRHIYFVLFILLTQVLAACGAPAPTPAPATPTPVPTLAPTVTPTPAPREPAEIVQSFWDAIEADDVDATMALIADNALCRGSCYFSGKATFLSFLQANINSGASVKISNLQVKGDKVTYTMEYYRNGFLQTSGSELMQVQDGKIVLWEVSSI